MITLVFATNNAHKAEEIEAILGPNFSVKTLKDIGCTTDIEESGSTLEENALIKAQYVKDNFGFDCFAEDTGLEVDALDGAPGVITARYAGEQKNADDNMKLLLQNLHGKDNRKAQFRTIVAFVTDHEQKLYEGICIGSIAEERRGGGGFGYDPIFVPEGYLTSFAEMSNEIKNTISHRALAMKLFLEDRKV